MSSNGSISLRPAKLKQQTQRFFPLRNTHKSRPEKEAFNLSESSSPRGEVEPYFRQIGNTPLLSKEEEVELSDRIKKGDTLARDLMIRSNLRLVVKIAHDYKNFGLPIMDLISEGNIGLIKAIERFDPEKGGKLSTYASWWIKQAIKRALANQSKTIRLPVHLIDKISKIRKATLQLNEELGREPNDEELSYYLDIPVNKIAHFKSVSSRPASLNAPASDDGLGTEFGEMVGDENARSPYEYLKEKSVHGNLATMFEKLDKRESEIIRLRFGIERDDSLTLEEIGNLFGITRERVRQLQNIALHKMRRMMSSFEKQYSMEELKQHRRNRQRMVVFGEFLRKNNVTNCTTT